MTDIRKFMNIINESDALVATPTIPKFNDLDGFTKGYFEAMLWTDEEDLNNDGADVNYHNIDPEDAAKQIADCERFKTEGAALLQQAWDQHHMSDESAGHDFWLTRNGHGAGFWDRDLDSDAGGKKLGDALTALCKKFGEVWTYVGDDKLIHIS